MVTRLEVRPKRAQRTIHTTVGAYQKRLSNPLASSITASVIAKALACDWL